MQQLYSSKKKPYYFFYFLIIFAVFLNGFTAFGQIVQTFTNSGSWTCPAGVTSIKIEAWGGGGGGGFATTTNKSSGGGGGGGAYRSSNTIAVTPGSTYFYSVGSGGFGGSVGGTAAANGNLSCLSTAINCGGTILTSAGGGVAGGSVTTAVGGAGGAGGNTGVFTSTSFNGGNGAAGNPGNSGFGGGGGGGAGTTSIGGNATAQTGGTGGTTGGGNGGNGANNTAGANGISIGGGGAGGNKQNTDNAGGTGGTGQIRITYAGYCTYASTSNAYWINNITTTNGFSNINNTTLYSVGGYGDYSSTAIVSQAPNGSFNFNVTTSSGTHGINIWVDWNNDYDFLDIGEKVYASGASYVTFANGTITIPAAQSIGNYRMRVVAHFLNTDPPFCGIETYTEAEDYTIQVTSPPSCYSPVALVTNTTSTTSGNATWNAPILGTAPSGYQYVISTSSVLPTGSGTPVGVNNISFSGLIPNTTYYVFVRSDCGVGDFSSWSGSYFFTGYCTPTFPSSSYYIDNFSTSGGSANIVNNASGYSVGGYGNFTAQVVSQVQNGSMSFSASFIGGTVGFNIWVDWNNDLDFNDLGEFVYASTAYVLTATGTFSVPGTATLGNHRMRIVADGFNTNPSSCVGSSSSETEDYTFNVSSPLPCAGNPSTISVFIVSGTSTTVSWTAGVPAPSSGYQYIYNTTNVFPAPAAIPTGSVAAGITSVTLTGLTAGSTYYFWVRANCTASATGTGVWIGTTIFTQPTCAIGSGTGTTTLACPSTISGGLGLSGAPAPPINCSSSGCANLEATFTPIKQTNNYSVTSIPYAPPYQFNCMRNPISVNIDDKWSPIITLPFNFCFYGNTYNKCLVGSNGVITFDIIANTPGGTNAWSISNNLPTTSLALNSIFGVYHDIDPSIAGGEVGYELITLNTGCRALVATWNNIAMFSSGCNAQKYTGMIVLYENTNIVDVYIKEKRVCAAWNNGNAIVGIQNATGTIATVAPNRNGLDPDWTVPTGTPEAWRFTPSGSNVPTSIKWYEGSGTSGAVIGTAATVNVCPASTKNYTAEITYTLCNGLTYSNTSQTTVTVATSKTWNGSVNTDWNVANNWTPNILPTATESINIPNVPNKPIIGSGVDALSCSINIASGSSITINPNNSITVTNAVNVAAGATFDIKNGASLIQVNNVINSGNITMSRTATFRYLDYVYWSSPVSVFPVTSVFPLASLNKIWKWNPTINGSDYGTWINANENMVIGKGYIIRAPSVHPTTNTAFTTIFSGVPNNGQITTPISRGTRTGANYPSLGGTATQDDDNFNLIGNPYPSAIDALSFIGANANLDGAVRLWTHGLLPSSAYPSPFYQTYLLNYSVNDYISYNSLGSSPPGFLGKIGAGQSFFVIMNHSAPTPGTIIFNNSMRSASYSNSQFYKAGKPPVSNTITTNEKHRIWLNLSDINGLTSTTLIGYTEGATSNKDRDFDAVTKLGNEIALYSIIENYPYVIQGKSLPFDQNDEVSLGVVIPSSGTYTFNINSLDGLFENQSQNIFLEDRLLGVFHDLRNTPYQIFLNQGAFEGRFYLRYTAATLQTNNFNLENSITIVSNQFITINSLKDEIKSIEVFDLLGKLLVEYKNIESKEFIITELRKNNVPLFLRIKSKDETITTKKIIY